MGRHLGVTDLTLRDGQQSLIATRMTTQDMCTIAEEMDKVGFHAIEAGGGAAFDVAIRFLNEDPWERIRRLKRLIRTTPLQIHLRGQSLVGYRQYSDDVVREFIYFASDCGIDIFRIFDTLNDEQNLRTCLEAAKKCNKHAQLQLQYSLTEQTMGGPIYNIDYYVKKALTYQEMGADSLCVSDPGGLLGPYDAYELVGTLKERISIPLEMRFHCNSGMASMSYLKAIEAGTDIIDTVIAPLSQRSSLPPCETMFFALQKSGYKLGLDIGILLEIGKRTESLLEKYREFLDTSISPIDVDVLTSQIPGGMTTNLLAQLKAMNALDRLEEVYNEIPQVRKELGYPPMATPASQIVVTQAVQNVLAGRYKLISRQVRDYINGLYGRPPGIIAPQVRKLAQVATRPPENESELAVAREAIKDMSTDMGDILIYALFPVNGMNFLREKFKR